MKKNQSIILLLVVLAVLISLFAVQVIAEKTITDRTLLRLGLPIMVCVLAIAKVILGVNRKVQNTDLFEAEYKDILRNAFAGENGRPLRKRLLNAIGLWNSDQYEKAIAQLQALLEHCQTSNDYAAVLMFLALSYTDCGLRQNAIDTYRTLLAHDDTRSGVWSNLGLLYKGKGNNLDALNCFDRALQLDGQNPYAYNNLASTHFALGNYDHALVWSQKALEIKSNLHQAASTACLACVALNDPHGAEKYYTVAVTAGADGKGLRQTMETVRAGKLHKESMAPYSLGVKQAMNDFYRATARPLVQCRIPAEGNRSRFGGPAIGIAPVDSQGKPMRLLCALYCSEFDNVPDMPSSGILQFYIADNGLYGADFDDPTSQKDFRIVYTEDEEAPEAEALPEDPTSPFPIHGRYPIAFSPDVFAMASCDFRFEETFNRFLAEQGAPAFRDLEDDVQEAIIEHFSCGGHRVGCAPWFTQEDPRDLKPEYAKYDTLLLQIDSHDDYIEIGDEGVMNFFIPREKLKNKDFSDVLYNWDCY